jgi:TRAP-type C4-dicarboxylate transport system substrate-binding protein
MGSSFSLAEEPKYVLKLATLAPDGSAWVKAFREAGKEIAAKTQNQLAVKLFPGGVLGDEEDMVRKMRIGQIQGAALTGAGLGILFKDMKIMAVPFLFQTYEEADKVLAHMDPYFRKGLETAGYFLAGWTETGFIYLLSRYPIKNVEDLRKGKVWIWEDTAMGKAVFKEARVSPVPLGIPDVMVSLQTGLVDTVYNSPSGAISLQWFTKVHYITQVPLAYSVGGVVIQKSFIDRLPGPYKEIIRESFSNHLQKQILQTRKENREALQVLAKHRIKSVTPSAKEIEEFQEICNRALDRLGEEVFTRKSLEEIRSYLKTLRQKNS